MISRQSAGRSGTPNSMLVLDQGQEFLVRPQSGMSVSRGVHSPLKRGGSSLEILPADEDESSITGIKLTSSRLGLHHSQSAGSLSRLDFSNDSDRSSSSDGKRELATPDSPRKQVNLTTVRRNFEQHGMPKNKELARAVQSPSPLQNGSVNRALSPTHKLQSASHRKEQVERIDHPENSSDSLDDAKRGLERLALEESSGHRSKDDDHEEERTKTDSYYISHSSICSNAKVISSFMNEGKDDYYLSHHKTTSETRHLPCDKMKDLGSHPDYSAPSHSASGGATQQPRDDQDDDGDDNSSDDSDEDDDEDEEEERKAPFQLMGEFLESVMEEDYENAEKLCKMVLLYEPDNAEAKQFQPLIEEMLKRERAAQLWGSESDDSESNSDDDDESDSDEESDDGDSNEDSDEDEAEDGSTEELDDEKKTAETTVEK